MTVQCIRNAPKAFGAGLIEEWENKTAAEAYEVLKQPDVKVTNAGDKDVQLPKLEKLDEFAKRVFMEDMGGLTGLVRQITGSLRNLGGSLKSMMPAVASGSMSTRIAKARIERAQERGLPNNDNVRAETERQSESEEEY